MTPTVQPTLTYNCPHCNATLEAPAHCGTQELNVCPACHQAFQVDLQGAALAAPAPVAPQAVPVAQPSPQAAAAPPTAVPAQPLTAAPAAMPAAAIPAEAPEAPLEQLHLSML